jgi:spore maturation protein CgeB
MGVDPSVYDPRLTELAILDGVRDIGLTLLADRTSPWRRDRLDRLSAAFPGGRFHGKGWPSGYLPPAEQVGVLQRTKVGPNLHNSTGPVNFRTFYLPANGILQICDNRSHLGRVFRVGEEAIGFDTLEECIDLCRYYLAHDRERREIAARGFRRAMTDYTEVPVFASKVAAIARHRAMQHTPTVAPARRQRERTPWAPLWSPVVEGGAAAAEFARRSLGWIRRRLP